MIYLDKKNWVQFDPDIWTFRAFFDGVIYGNYTDDIADPSIFPFPLDAATRTALKDEKASYIAKVNADPGASQEVKKRGADLEALSQSIPDKLPNPINTDVQVDPKP